MNNCTDFENTGEYPHARRPIRLEIILHPEIKPHKASQITIDIILIKPFTLIAHSLVRVGLMDRTS